MKSSDSKLRKTNSKRRSGHVSNAQDRDDLSHTNGVSRAWRENSEAMHPIDVLTAQPIVGNHAVQRILAPQSLVRHPIIQRSFLQRETKSIEVKVVKVPKQKGTIEDIILETFTALEVYFDHFVGALDNFQTTVIFSSKEEATPRSSDSIIAEHAAKFFLKLIKDKVFEIIPHAAVVKEVVEQITSTIEDIEKEKKRSEKATTENELKTFITNLRTKILNAQGKVKTAKQQAAVESQEEYDQKKSEGEKRAYRSYVETKYKMILDDLDGPYSINALFQLIATEWINQSTVPGTKYAAYVEIKLYKDWTAISAQIHAPLGSRIAEQMVSHGSVNLDSFLVPRVIYWYPESDKKEYPYAAYCFAREDARNQAFTDPGANIFGQPYLQQFVRLLVTKPLPSTIALSGDKKTD